MRFKSVICTILTLKKAKLTFEQVKLTLSNKNEYNIGMKTHETKLFETNESVKTEFPLNYKGKGHSKFWIPKFRK